MKTEIDCRSCSALCCGPNQSLTLNARELRFFKNANPRLNQYGVPSSKRRFFVVRPDGTKEVRGIYNFGERCGFLVKKDGWIHCSIHDDPKKPLECSITEVGGSICRTAIEAGGKKL